MEKLNIIIFYYIEMSEFSKKKKTLGLKKITLHEVDSWKILEVDSWKNRKFENYTFRKKNLISTFRYEKHTLLFT